MGLRILLVDDDESCLSSLESFLIADGHDTFTACRGREAVDIARQCRQERLRVDLSILDYRMPELSGIETFRQLTVELPETPAIFVSGESSPALEARVQSIGGLVLMPKPVQVGRMRSFLEAFQRGISDA